MAKFYRLPPKFSLDLTYSNLRILGAAPVCTMAICFWMLGNRQMFGNKDIGFVLKSTDVVPTYHHLGKTLQRILNFDLSRVEGILIIAFLIQLTIFLTKTAIQTILKIRTQIYGI